MDDEAMKSHREKLAAWRQLPAGEQIRRLNARFPAGPGPKPDDGPDDGRLVVHGYGNSGTGYGRLTAHLVRQLDRAGIPSVFSPECLSESDVPLDPALKGRLVGRKPARPLLQLTGPPTPFPAGSVVLTMWETSRLSREMVDNLNEAACVVVPCRWNADCFRESGVTAPIRVVPLGIDPATYRPTAPEPAGEFVVHASARISGGGHRKGFDDVVAAFLGALGDREDCRLVLKSFGDCPVDAPDHPRITLDRTAYSDEGMANWYGRASVGLSMSRSEGWGMTPHEQLACGRPVIAPIHTGHGDYMTTECCYPVDFDGEPASGPYYDYEGSGLWYRPRVGSAIEQLRAAYHDPARRRRMGEEAAKRAREFTWERSGRMLAGVLREFGLVPPGPPKFDPDAHSRIKLLIAGCDYRGEKVECGCAAEVRVCLAGKGRRHPGADFADVTEKECRRCVGAVS